MMMMMRLVMLVTMATCSPHLLVLDQTRCYSGDPDPEPVVGADQVVRAVNWTLERMSSSGNFQESGIIIICSKHFDKSFLKI